MQPSRDEIIIDLAASLPKEEVLAILKLQRELRVLDKDMDNAKKKHLSHIKEFERQMHEIQLQCEHPHTHTDSGGQYESQRTYCSICGRELK